MSYKYVVVSKNIHPDKNKENYDVAITYKNNLTISYISNNPPVGVETFILKGDEIKDVIFDGDLFVESTLGNFVLEDVISVKCWRREDEL